jgi:RNA polymerase primary sigma factor
MKQLVITSRVTNRESDSFQRYLKEIAQIPVFTPEEESACALKASLGDVKAREELIKRNLRFVVSVAKQYATAANPLEDLVNEGNIGLMKAADKFDPNMDLKFISYGVWWIRKLILEYLSKNGRMVRLPANKLNALSKLDKMITDLEQKLGRRVDIQEVIAEFDKELEAEDFAQLDVLNTYSVDSLDREIDSDDNTHTLADMLADTDSYKPTDHLLSDDDVKSNLNRVLSKLKPRERIVICSIYGLEGHERKTLKEIGDDLGVSREMARQIKETALETLKEKLSSSNISIS